METVETHRADLRVALRVETTVAMIKAQLRLDSGCSGSIPNASRYLMVDALYWKFQDSSFAGGNFGGVGAHDFELGLRTTFGRRFDATSGEEAVYSGMSEWRTRTEFNDPFGRLGGNFAVVPPFGAPEASALFNGTDQVQLRESNLHSLEYNRTRWGWDVVKTMVGLRGIYFRDRFLFFNDTGTETGIINVDAENFLFGPHVGMELFYDVGYRLSYSFFGKAGMFFNANTLDTQLTNAGRSVINRSETNSTYSYNFELGAVAHYQLTPQARLRAGYNLLWLNNVSTGTENFPSAISVNTGGSVADNDDILFHGLSFGLEIYR